MRIDVLGVGFDNLTMQEAVAAGLRLAGSPGCHYVVTPNPEIVEVCRENLAAKIAVNEADLVLPDGIGVVKGAAMLGTPLKERAEGGSGPGGQVPVFAGGEARRGGNGRPQSGAEVSRPDRRRDP